MKEEWKVYKEFDRPWNAKIPKHYIIEVSNYGNVKMNGEIVEPYINSGGYKCCHSFKISRAVAELFIPNPENKPAVDHIDTNRLNDNITNLRWVTNTENMNNPLTRKNLSNALKCRKGIKSMLGKHHSEDARKKQSEKAKERTGEKNGMYGKHHSEETKQKLREARKRYLLNKSKVL